MFADIPAAKLGSSGVFRNHNTTTDFQENESVQNPMKKKKAPMIDNKTNQNNNGTTVCSLTFRGRN